MGIALAGRNDSAREIGLGDIDLSGQGAIEEGEINGVAVSRLFSGVEAGKNRDSGVKARQDIGHGYTHFERRTFDGSRYRHEAAECLNREIVTWPIAPGTGSTKTRDGTDNQPGMSRKETIRCESQTCRAVTPKILDQDVAFLQQTMEKLLALGSR